MEPAPFSAGNSESNGIPHPRRSASMEPAPFSAGNSPYPVQCAAAHRGFNGAGAFQRRKQAALWRLSQSTSGFNGAGAFQRRKHRDARRASTPKPSLQWSRRLSAPETTPRMYSFLKLSSLQWSRRLSAPETRRETQRNQPAEEASMEPAPFSAGNRQRRADAVSDARCFNGAGAFQRRKRYRQCPSLARLHRFNGAGAFQRRKPQERCHVRAARITLQWSRRLSAPETSPASRVGTTPTSRASMEPAPFSAGNLPSAGASPQCAQASMEPAPFSAGNKSAGD